MGPHQNTKYQSLLIKKKKPNFVRDQNLKVFIQMEWDIYIYTQKIIKQNIVTKKERGVRVRLKRNKPEIERLEIRERERERERERMS